MYCPVFLEFKDLTLPTLNKPELSSFELEDLTETTMGPSVYSLKILPPQINNQLNIAPFNSLQVQIPSIEPFRNKVRLQLQPSIGYGQTACYRVEYWKHTKIYLPAGKTGRPIKEKCRVEYWYVPAADGRYILNYRDWERFTPKFDNSNLKTVEFTKATNPSQTLEANLDIILINRIVQNGEAFTDYVLTDTSLTDFEAPIVSLDWGVNAPAVGTYQIEYINPIKHSELIFQDLKGKVLPESDVNVDLVNPYPTGFYF